MPDYVERFSPPCFNGFLYFYAVKPFKPVSLSLFGNDAFDFIDSFNETCIHCRITPIVISVKNLAYFVVKFVTDVVLENVVFAAA